MNCFAMFDTRTRTYEDGDAGTRDHNQAELFGADEADRLASADAAVEIVPIIPFTKGVGRR